MFQKAVAIANEFTFPYVGLRRRADGGVFSVLGAFVVVNAEGWVLTAGHIVDEIISREQERTVTPGDPAAEQPADTADGRVTARTEIWALPGFLESHPRVVEARMNRLADLALCRLEPFDAATVRSFPVFRDSAADPIEQGTSVCRLGFPFYDVDAAFDETGGGFALSPAAFPVPRFALDGIVARFHRVADEAGGASGFFIETSTPGLRGQSGGPLLDVRGRVCGIQSHTSHLDLGFDARYESRGETVVERQFLNVGAASHVDEIVALCAETGVNCRLA